LRLLRSDGVANSLGTQSISRVAAILRSIARFGPDGARLHELSHAVKLARPTTHRILRGLIEERLVAQDQPSRRYRLGRLTFELGLATTWGTVLVETCRPILRRLAAASGDTIYLVVRSGFETVCLDRIEGSFPIRTVTLDIGGRRPLGLGAGGLALLAALDDVEVEQVIQHHERDLAAYGGLTADRLRYDVAAARSEGFGHIEGRLTPGVSGIGIVVPNVSGAPFAAVSIASISSRMTADRLRELKLSLRSEIATLADRLLD
jgi:DNA-binding IclR family transcriptional regulator